ncbi:hypothetical protein C8R44DRAFT_741737 [Mycena epipterygia]|nr:hypothetical protein C8R44DRAFT_741737 [Mycena epipterygia]
MASSFLVGSDFAVQAGTWGGTDELLVTRPVHLNLKSPFPTASVMHMANMSYSHATETIIVQLGAHRGDGTTAVEPYDVDYDRSSSQAKRVSTPSVNGTAIVGIQTPGESKRDKLRSALNQILAPIRCLDVAEPGRTQLNLNLTGGLLAILQLNKPFIAPSDSYGKYCGYFLPNERSGCFRPPIGRVPLSLTHPCGIDILLMLDLCLDHYGLKVYPAGLR